jgi:hypothetical protein
MGFPDVFGSFDLVDRSYETCVGRVRFNLPSLVEWPS